MKQKIYLGQSRAAPNIFGLARLWSACLKRVLSPPHSYPSSLPLATFSRLHLYPLFLTLATQSTALVPLCVKQRVMAELPLLHLTQVVMFVSSKWVQFLVMTLVSLSKALCHNCLLNPAVEFHKALGSILSRVGTIVLTYDGSNGSLRLRNLTRLKSLD